MEENATPSAETEVMDFSDESTSEPEQTTETEQPETEQPQETKPEKPSDDDFVLPIKYNGAEEKLTREQAIELAQKGRNYDKISQRLNDVLESPVLKTIAEQAERAGLTMEQYAERLGQFQKQSDINRLAKDFKSKHADASDEVAKAYAEQAYLNQINEKTAQEQKAQADSKAQLEQTAKNYLDAFLKEYPDVDVRNLPDEVKNDVDNNGMSLLDAYHAYDLKITKQALAAERQNKANRASATGTMSNNQGNVEEKDPFLQGLFG